MIVVYYRKTAKEVSLNAGVIVEVIFGWLENNRVNDRYYYDGRYWSYVTTRVLELLLPKLEEQR